MGRLLQGVVACAAMAGLLTACSSSAALDPADVEQQIAEGLTEQVGGDFTVACPSEVPAEAGYAFSCTVTDHTAGGAVTVSVVEDDAVGAFSWRVTGQSGSTTSAPVPSGESSPTAAGR